MSESNSNITWCSRVEDNSKINTYQEGPGRTTLYYEDQGKICMLEG